MWHNGRRYHKVQPLYSNLPERLNPTHLKVGDVEPEKGDVAGALAEAAKQEEGKEERDEWKIGETAIRRQGKVNYVRLADGSTAVVAPIVVPAVVASRGSSDSWVVPPGEAALLVQSGQNQPVIVAASQPYEVLTSSQPYQPATVIESSQASQQQPVVSQPYQPYVQPVIVENQPYVQPVLGSSQPYVQPVLGSSQPYVQPVVGSSYQPVQPVVYQPSQQYQPQPVVVQPVGGSSYQPVQAVLQPAMCVAGCGRPRSTGTMKDGRPYETCCRNCAKTNGAKHDKYCGQPQRHG